MAERGERLIPEPLYRVPDVLFVRDRAGILDPEHFPEPFTIRHVAWLANAEEWYYLLRADNGATIQQAMMERDLYTMEDSTLLYPHHLEGPDAIATVVSQDEADG